MQQVKSKKGVVERFRISKQLIGQDRDNLSMLTAVVYPIRPKHLDGNSHCDELLRYSLRSLERYGKFYDTSKVYMIGERREWMSDRLNVIAIESDKPSKFERVRVKLQTFAYMEIPFVLMNDDFILTKNQDLSLRHWATGGTMNDLAQDYTKSSGYRAMVERTVRAYGIDWQEKCVMVHTPFLFDDPELLIEMNYNGHSSNTAISVRQAYMALRNKIYGAKMKPKYYSIETKEMGLDCKIYEPSSVEYWHHLMKVAPGVISTAPTAVNENLLSVLAYLYPEKSKYEK
jgi:hypothetical protein